MDTHPKIGDHIHIQSLSDTYYVLIEWVGTYDNPLINNTYASFAGTLFEVDDNGVAKRKGPYSGAYLLTHLTQVGETVLPHYYIVEHRKGTFGDRMVAPDKIRTLTSDTIYKQAIVVGEFP